MIRSLWTLIATLSVANFAAIVALLAWLGASDRLSTERINALRATFSDTVAEEAAEQSRAEQEIAELERRRAEEGEPGAFPLDTETVMALWNDRDAEARQRYQRELAALRHLREDVDQRREALEAEVRRFEARVNAWEEQRAEAEQRRASEQFNQAVKLLSLTDPETARNMLASLLEEGQTDNVVNYLDALKPDTAQPILNAFAEEDPAMAAGLLERLRTLGEDDAAQTPPTRANDQAAAPGNP